MREQVIYRKKRKTEGSEYHYYVTKKGNYYYVYIRVVDYIPVTPTWVVQRSEGKTCLLKLNEEQAKEVIGLLKSNKYDEFEENYGEKYWLVCN